MSVDVPEARRLTSPAWLNARTVLGLLLFCASVIGGQRFIQSSATTTLVWSAARDLPKDTRLTATDFRPVEVRLPAELQDRYVGSTTDLAGVVLSRAVLEGELIHEGWLSTPGSAGEGRSMTIPVSPEHAVGGALGAGDRVDVYATFDPGDVRARTTLLARDVEIVEVVTAGGFALDDESLIGVTVSVSPEEAARLAFAIRTAELDVVKITGDASTSGSSTVRSRDFP